MDKHPIKNDPFLFVADAFERLHPNVKYDSYVMDWFKDEFGEGYGVTVFPDDGSDPVIYLNSETPYVHLVEIFAHELAHVAVGKEKEHEADWEREFDRIFDEYNKIMTELFDEEEQPIENENHA